MAREMAEGSGSPLEGRYANYFKIGHNAFEFVLEFGQKYSESEEARIHTRIVLGPAYVKAFSETLQRAVEAFNCSYGPLPESPPDKPN